MFLKIWSESECTLSKRTLTKVTVTVGAPDLLSSLSLQSLSLGATLLGAPQDALSLLDLQLVRGQHLVRDVQQGEGTLLALKFRGA